MTDSAPHGETVTITEAMVRAAASAIFEQFRVGIFPPTNIGEGGQEALDDYFRKARFVLEAAMSAAAVVVKGLGSRGQSHI